MGKDTLGLVEITVRVIPGASKNEIAGKVDGIWKVRLTAPPVDGRANRALTEYLADKLGLKRVQVALIRGQTSREKTLAIRGLSADEITQALAGE